MSEIKTIIFDFDGVILESVEVKKIAFQKLFEAYTDKVDKIVQYHMDHGGLSRYKKFEYIYEEMLNKDLTEEESLKLGNQLSEYAYKGVIESPFVRGALEFLEKYYQEYNMYVVSGTPEEELFSVIKDRELGKYFKGIYGSPRLKGELNKLILSENNYNPEEVVFIGDAITDYNGAIEAGIHFIGRIHEKYDNPFEDISGVHLIKNLDKLQEDVNSINSIR